MPYKLVAVRQQVNVEHVRRLHVHHEVPCVGERGLARHAVEELLLSGPGLDVVVVVHRGGRVRTAPAV